MTEGRGSREGRPRRYVLWLMLLDVLALSLAVGGAAGAQTTDSNKGGNEDTSETTQSADNNKGGSGGTSEAKILNEYKVPVNQPEGVVYDKKTKAFYGGSSLTDGKVYKATLNGKTKVFIRPARTVPGRPTIALRPTASTSIKRTACT